MGIAVFFYLHSTGSARQRSDFIFFLWRSTTFYDSFSKFLLLCNHSFTGSLCTYKVLFCIVPGTGIISLLYHYIPTLFFCSSFLSLLSVSHKSFLPSTIFYSLHSYFLFPLLPEDFSLPLFILSFVFSRCHRYPRPLMRHI